jgi:hypothetical protein
MQHVQRVLISSMLQVCAPDVRGRCFAVTGMFPSHSTLQRAAAQIDLVMHDAWHGPRNKVRGKGLYTPEAAAEFSRQVGATCLLLSSRGALEPPGLHPRPCTSAESLAMKHAAQGAAPGMTVEAPEDLHLAVLGHIV